MNSEGDSNNITINITKNNSNDNLNTTTENIVKRTRQLTGGSLLSGGGFDCVVNSQGGEWWSKGLRCLKQGGRMVANGALAGHDPPTDIRYIFQGELEIRGSNGWDHSDIINLVEIFELTLGNC